MKRRALLVALAGLAALAAAVPFASCRHKSAVAPAEPAPLQVLVVQPPARSAGYAYDGQIWALFDRSLDPKTVDTTTVFLKLDTQRLGCSIGYEPTSRRIVVVPRTALALNRTYTVLVTTRVRAKDGAALAADYEWQFSTSSIGRIVYQAPSPAEVQTPVAMLAWSSPGAVAGQLLYEVYAGTDSAAVHNRTAPRLSAGTNAYYLPTAFWPYGARIYWALTTTNQATGEKLLSPVTTFTVQADGAPTRVVTMNPIEWGAARAGTTTQYCLQSYVPVGSAYTSAFRFAFDPSTMGRRVRSAMLVTYASGNLGLIPGVSVWACAPNWYACGMVAGGPPFPDAKGPLATARVGTTSSQMVFESPALAAWAEGMLRGGDFSGLQVTLTTTSSLNINMSGSSAPWATLTLVVYD